MAFFIALDISQRGHTHLKFSADVPLIPGRCAVKRAAVRAYYKDQEYAMKLLSKLMLLALLLEDLHVKN